MKTPAVDDIVLARYLAGEGTADDEARVHAWSTSDHRHAALLKVLERTWQLEELIPQSLDVEMLIGRALQRDAEDGLAFPRQVPQKTQQKATARARTQRLRAVAWQRYTLAALICMIVGAVVTPIFMHRGPRRPSPMTSYVTEKGQHARITLADGATAYLSVDSRLDVPVDYAAGNRALRLSGEASFTVPHRTGTPFTVTTRSVTMRVLGTHFLVRQYGTDSTTLVSVREGKIAVHSHVVSAAEAAEIDAHGTVRMEQADSAAFGFEMGRVTLKGLSLLAAIPELNRQYNVDIRLADASLATRRFNGECGPMSPADLANALKLMFDVKVVRDGRMLTLYTR